MRVLGSKPWCSLPLGRASYLVEVEARSGASECAASDSLCHQSSGHKGANKKTLRVEIAVAHQQVLGGYACVCSQRCSKLPVCRVGVDVWELHAPQRLEYLDQEEMHERLQERKMHVTLK